MALENTYTSSFRFVSDGDTTYEDPSNLTGENNLTIANAEIQWEGSETTSSSTSHSTNTNSGSATATETTTTKSETNQNESSDSTIDGSSLNTNVSTATPSVSGTVTGYIIKLEAKIIDDQTSTQNGQVLYDTNSGSSSTSISADGTWVTVYNKFGSGSVPNSSYGVVADHSPSADLAEVGVRATVTVDYDETTVNSDTTSVSYPSVPNGYSFDYHYWREEKNGSYVDSGYVYSNSVGQSRSVTSNDPDNTWTLEMETRGEDTTTTTNYTQDPSVSGDVSGSTGATLSDNETSNWQPLSGLSSGDNTFNHSISDSGEAYYRIRFDWERTIPIQVGTLKFYRNGTKHSVRLADPSDYALVYNTIRVNTDELGIVAIDAVNTDNKDAAPITLSHPTHGTITFREI